MTQTWQTLLMTTLRTPDEAAEIIMDTPISRTEMWLSVLLAAALNALATGISLTLMPLPEGWPSLFGNPMSYFVIIAGGLVLLGHILTWSGRWIGGTGALDDIIKLIVWLQLVRIVLQVVGLVIVIAAPLLGALYGLATGLLSLWILLHFVRAGHRLESLGTAALVLFATFVGLVIGLSLLLSLIGVGSLGVVPSV